MKKGVRAGTVFFLIVATACVSAIATYYYLSMIVNDLGKNQQMYIKLDRVNEIVSQNYINRIDPVNGYTRLSDSLISGYIDGLADPYSYYLDEKNYQAGVGSLDGSSNDIGVRTSYDKTRQGIRVDFVKKGSPAEAAGIKNGDVIIAVDGNYVSAEGFRKSVQKLLGKKDSSVELTIIRRDTNETVTYLVIRSEYASRTVESSLVSSGVGYIAINEFDKNTSNDFSVACSELQANGASGLIIDLRNTCAGDLEYLVNVADQVLPAAQVIVSVKEKSASKDTVYYSDEKHIEVPIVVIQNEETAGLAEVFSAALRDTGRATIVGTVSKGIGIGQRDFPLSDGTSIRLSCYEYITPSGEHFHSVGIEPNFVSVLDPEKMARFDTLSDEEDDQLQFAVQKLKEIAGIE